MTDLRKAAEMALEALENSTNFIPVKTGLERDTNNAIQALRQALAQPVDAVNMSQERVDETAKREQEPVAWYGTDFEGNPTKFRLNYFSGSLPLYTAPQKRGWTGLTDAQVEEIAEYHGIDSLYETSRIDFYRAIEITLKEKNT